MLIGALACAPGCGGGAGAGAPGGSAAGGTGGTGGSGAGDPGSGRRGGGGDAGGAAGDSSGDAGSGGARGGAAGTVVAGRGGSPAGTGGGGTAGSGGSAAGTAGGGTGGSAAGGSGGSPAGIGGSPAGTGGGGAAGSGGATAACDQVWRGDIQTGTALDDEITAVTAAAGGGFYVTGYERGDDQSTDIIPAGDARAVVARYDGSGALMWEETIDTSGADTAEDLQVDPATGNLIVLGRTTGAFSGFQNQGQFDLYVATLNSSGNLLGAIQIGDERPQHPVRLGLGPERAILVAGYDDLFIDVNFVAALEHGFFAEVTGGVAPTFAPAEDFWQRSAYLDSPPPPRSNQDFTTGVAVDPTGDGSFYVSSTVNGLVDQRGIFVSKVNAAGQTLWSNRLSGEAGDFLAAIGFSPNGDLIVGGTAAPEVIGTEVGQQDAFAARVDKTTGAVIWATGAGSVDADFTTAMAFDAAGNIYLTGQMLAASGTAGQGTVDIFVAKIGPSGGVQSYWQRGSAGDDMAASIAVDACGRVLVGGFTTGALVAGQPNAGRRDMFVVKADLR
ncbi:MAG TPA: hypothetical protein VIF57_31940 [Polyangia bacterium]|jgi:hypothetical protein